MAGTPELLLLVLAALMCRQPVRCFRSREWNGRVWAAVAGTRTGGDRRGGGT